MEFKKKIISSRDKIQVKKESAKKSTVSREKNSREPNAAQEKFLQGEQGERRKIYIMQQVAAGV